MGNKTVSKSCEYLTPQPFKEGALNLPTELLSSRGLQNLAISEDQELLVALDPSKMVVYSAQTLQILSEPLVFEKDLFGVFESKIQLYLFQKKLKGVRVLQFIPKSVKNGKIGVYEDSEKKDCHGLEGDNTKDYSLVLEFAEQIILEYSLNLKLKTNTGWFRKKSSQTDYKLSISLIQAQDLNQEPHHEISQRVNQMKKSLEEKKQRNASEKAEFLRGFEKFFTDEDEKSQLIELETCWIFFINSRMRNNPNRSTLAIISKSPFKNPIIVHDFISELLNYKTCLDLEFVELRILEKSTESSKLEFSLLLGTAKDLISARLELAVETNQGGKATPEMKVISKKVRTYNVLIKERSDLYKCVKFVDLKLNNNQLLKLFLLNCESIAKYKPNVDYSQLDFWSPPITYILIGHPLYQAIDINKETREDCKNGDKHSSEDSDKDRQKDSKDQGNAQFFTRLLKTTELVAFKCGALDQSKLVDQSILTHEDNCLVVSATGHYMEVYSNLIKINAKAKFGADGLPVAEAGETTVLKLFDSPVISLWQTNAEAYAGDDSGGRKYVDFDELREDDIREQTEKRKVEFDQVLVEEFSKNLLNLK